MKLWGRLTSINVQKAAWCLVEVGAPFERIEAGGAFGVVNTPEYRRMNPNGLVPTLDHDGFVLWESNSIIRYLGNVYADKALYPNDPKARARVDQWVDWQATDATPHLRDAFWGLIRSTPEARDAALVAKSLAASDAVAAILDAHLAGRDYVAGDTFTIADIATGCHAHRWLNLPVERQPRANLQRWYERLAARPASRIVFDLPLS